MRGGPRGFRILKGPQGSQGPRVPGSQGPQGSQGPRVPGSQGPQGSKSPQESPVEQSLKAAKCLVCLRGFPSIPSSQGSSPSYGG